MERYIIIREENQILSFLLDEFGKAVEIHCDPIEQHPAVGDIVIGRVQKVMRSLNAAFVDVAQGRTCYLPLEQVRDPVYTKKGSSPNLQQGDELIVQIAREPMKTKAASLTTAICLHGRFVVLSRNGESGVSKKITGDERARLKDLHARLEETCLDGVSLVIRTNAKEASEEEITAECLSLQETLAALLHEAPHRPAYSQLYTRPDAWMERLMSLPAQDHLEIVVEDAGLFDRLTRDDACLTEQQKRQVQLHADPMWDLKARFRLEKQLSDALSKKVWLSSGAYLVIEATEALHVIDVNSGKTDAALKGAGKEAAHFKINLEAAKECARQIRLRNLSGIILIDFISMEDPDHRSALLSHLRGLTAADPVRTVVVDQTKLELVELTRKKIEKPLAETRNKL